MRFRSPSESPAALLAGFDVVFEASMTGRYIDSVTY